MTGMRRIAGIGIALATLCVPDAGLGQDPWMTVIGGTDMVALADDTLARIRIPLELAPGARPDSAWIVDVVTAGGVRLKRHFDAFELHWPAPGSAPAVLLDVDLAVLQRPDTFRLRIAAVDSASTARIDVRVLRPAARLRGPDVLRIHQVGGDRRVTPFVIEETGGLSRVTGLRLQSRSFTTDSAPAGIGIALVDSATGSLAAGASRELAYRLTADPPLGTTRGVAELRAPELGAPLEVRVEVVRRLSVWWLFWLIFVGALVGWAAKVALETRHVLGSARRDARHLVDELRKAQLAHNDEVFRKKVDALILRLRIVIATGSAEEIRTEIDIVRGEWKELPTTKATRREPTRLSPVSDFLEVEGPKFLQVVLFATVISGAGMLLLGEDFVGDAADLIAGFVWGFSLDLTARTIADKTKLLRA